MPHPFPNLPPEQRGTVHTLDLDSRVLKANPMGDPSRRDVFVYTPPGYRPDGPSLPAIVVLPGYTGMGEKLLARGFTDVSIATRADALIADGVPPFVLVMPDCMTRLGGSQYVDSDGLGHYTSYIVDEVRGAVSDRFNLSGKWGVTGHSSGGFGALHLAMTRPGAFQAVASHAGDLGFDLCYMADLPKLVSAVNACGGLAAFVDGFWQRRNHSGTDIAAMMMLCVCCAYLPKPGREPLPCRIPVNLETGAVDFAAFEELCAMDPIRRLNDPEQVDGLRRLDLLFIDAGRFDEYNLQVAARRFAAGLSAAGVSHVHEEFDGGHRGMAWRYSVSLTHIAEALSE
jgi:enterochelin esterase family protein